MSRDKSELCKQALDYSQSILGIGVLYTNPIFNSGNINRAYIKGYQAGEEWQKGQEVEVAKLTEEHRLESEKFLIRIEDLKKLVDSRENTMLKLEITTLKIKMEEQERLIGEHHLSELRTADKIVELENILHKINTESVKMDKCVDELELKIEEQESTLRSIQKERDSLINTVVKLKSDTKEQEGEIVGLKKDLEKVRSYNEAIDNIIIVHLQKELQDRNAVLKQQQKILDGSWNEIQTQENTIRELYREIASIHKAVEASRIAASKVVTNESTQQS